MPFKSRAQLRRFGAMVKRGEISEQTFKEWLNETPNVKRLPERVRKNRRKTKRR